MKKHKVVESRENMQKLRSLKKFGKQVCHFMLTTQSKIAGVRKTEDPNLLTVYFIGM